MARWVWPTAAGIVTSATGVVINVATDRADSVLAWVGVVALTALGVGVGVAAQRSDQRHREAVQRAAALAAPERVPERAPEPAPARHHSPRADHEQPTAPPSAAPPHPAPQQPHPAQPQHEHDQHQQPRQRPVPRSVHNHSSGNTVGPVIQVGYLHGNFNQGNSVNQNATAYDGGTVHQAGRDVRLDDDR